MNLCTRTTSSKISFSAFSNSVDINILVHNYTSIEDGEFVFIYEEGEDAVFSLSFTPKHLNVDNIELLWEFQHKNEENVEKVR